MGIRSQKWMSHCRVRSRTHARQRNYGPTQGGRDAGRTSTTIELFGRLRVILSARGLCAGAILCMRWFLSALLARLSVPIVIHLLTAAPPHQRFLAPLLCLPPQNRSFITQVAPKHIILVHGQKDEMGRLKSALMAMYKQYPEVRLY